MILRSIFELAQKQQRILEIEDLMSASEFWHDQQTAKALTKEVNRLKSDLEIWTNLEKELAEIDDLSRMAQKENDSSITLDLKAKFEHLKGVFDDFKVNTFLSEKYDSYDAIMSIHAGAGGTDAQDWAEMLLRMYLRFSEQKKYKTAIIDESRGNEAGIKSVVLEIVGSYAYGHLKSEAGVHRLVRLSPYNPTHTRETSFALVEIFPAIEETEFKINPEDLEIEAKTSRGHGGQSVNTTYSAIRMTHKPSGITVTIQNERSQAQNKAQALKILSSKLALLDEEKRRQEKLQLRGEFHSAEWGNQIRSYVIHPYKLVKDHRTNYETSDTNAVLNGSLDEFIKSYLENTKIKE